MLKLSTSDPEPLFQYHEVDFNGILILLKENNGFKWQLKESLLVLCDKSSLDNDIY